MSKRRASIYILILCWHFVSQWSQYVSLQKHFVSFWSCFLSLCSCFVSLSSHFMSRSSLSVFFCVKLFNLCGHFLCLKSFYVPEVSFCVFVMSLWVRFLSLCSCFMALWSRLSLFVVMSSGLDFHDCYSFAADVCPSDLSPLKSEQQCIHFAEVMWKPRFTFLLFTLQLSHPNLRSSLKYRAMTFWLYLSWAVIKMKHDSSVKLIHDPWWCCVSPLRKCCWWSFFCVVSPSHRKGPWWCSPWETTFNRFSLKTKTFE